MKTMFVAVAALIASPAFAQSAKQMTSIPDTALSTATTPSSGPRAQEADLPTNSAASANLSALASNPAATAPDAPLAEYPICTVGQFDNCMEPGNAPKPPKRPRKPN